MSIAVTGGAGFIGSAVAQKLHSRGDDVLVIDNFNQYYSPKLKEARVHFLLGDSVKLERIDITDYEAVKEAFRKHKVKKIVHLAAQPGVRYAQKAPEVYERNNVLGTLQVVRAAIESKVENFVFASSSSVYGLNKEFPSKESQPVQTPVSLYAATKIAGENILHAYAKMFSLPVTVLRFFTVYGPWIRPDMALFIFAQRIARGEPIPVYNFGKSAKDFTYIDDIVSGVISALDLRFVFEVINLGNAVPVQLMEYIAQLEKYLGKKAEKQLLPAQPGDVNKSYADIQKAKELLNYDPKTTVSVGVAQFVEWFTKYQDPLGLLDMREQ